MKRLGYFCLVLLSLTSCSFFKRDASAHQKDINGMSFESLVLPNKLEVLLVSDSRFKKSSAAMAVMVGSLSNPQKAQGLAHYLEHMLFLGTKEFPQHDEYSKYMETHGGWDNAYTSDEITNYMFELDHAGLKGGLERFSRFFVSPTFDATYMEREKKAVHSEFQKNLKNDDWRLHRFMSQLAKAQHPLRKFSTGSNETLKDVSRDEVVDFYKKYYSANNMKLVIMGAESPEVLKEWASEYFSDVPNWNVKRPQFDPFYFSKKDQHKMHFVKSIEDTEDLIMLFNVEDDRPYWKTKPTQILGRILGHEGPGSLLSVLKEKGWAQGLVAGSRFWNSFGVNISLTAEGHKNYQKVISQVLAYIELIRQEGYPKYLFEDEKSMRQIDLDNLEPSSSGRRAAWFARAMTDYPVQEFLERYFLLKEYSPQHFHKFLGYLTLKNSHIVLTSKKEKTNKVEDIFGIQYRSEEIPKSLFAKVTAEPSFRYPEKNKYIPSDFSLVKRKAYEDVQVFQREPAQKFYYRLDTELQIAKAFYGLRFQSDIENNPRNSLLSQLYVLCKEEELREWISPIQEARVDLDLTSVSADTLMVTIGGYSHRLLDTLKDYLGTPDGAIQFKKCQISEQLFSKIKEKAAKELINKDQAVPSQRLMEEVYYLSSNKSIHWREYKDLLPKIQLKDVQEYAQDFFRTLYVTVDAYGNVERDSLNALGDAITSSLNYMPMDSAKADSLRRQFRLAGTHSPYSMVVTGQNNNFSMVSRYQWGDWSPRDHAMIILIGQLIAQPYFSELRTNQQLGYVARVGASFNAGYVGLSAILQSDKYDSLELKTRSEKFLTEYLQEKAKNLTGDEIKPVQDALLNELLKRPNTLAERYSQFRDGIYNYSGRMNLREEIAEHLKNITAQDVKKFIQEKTEQSKPRVIDFFYYGSQKGTGKSKLPGKVFEKASDVKDWIYKDPYKI